MPRNKLVSSGKRFGSRYGRRNRDKFALAERSARAKYSCPKCAYLRVRRKAAGIWLCGKCGNKFASKAYTVAKPLQLRRQAEEV